MSLSSVSSYLAICSLVLGTVKSLVIPSPQNVDGSITLTQPSLLVPSSNASAEDLRLQSTNVSTSLKVAKIECDEHRFGNPPVASCQDAIEQLPQDPRTIIINPNQSYGPRGQGNWDVNLPKRYISCKWLAIPCSPPQSLTLD